MKKENGSIANLNMGVFSLRTEFFHRMGSSPVVFVNAHFVAGRR